MSNLEKPLHQPENPEQPGKSAQPQTMPNEHPQKQGLFANIADALRKLSESLGIAKLFGLQEGDKKTNKLQEFFANMLGIFQGIDIEKGVTIKKTEDISKVREAFRPIIDLDDTSIEFKEGDFIRYNKELGTVDFYPADSTQKSGHAIDPNRGVVVGPRLIPVPQEDEKSEQTDNSNQKPSSHSSHSGGNSLSQTPIETHNNNTPQESYEKTKYPLASQLGKFVRDIGPQDNISTPHKGDCGWAVSVFLEKFNMNPNRKMRGNGNEWYGILSRDPRFKLVPVNSLSDIPSGGILTFDGSGTNQNPRSKRDRNGKTMNQKYGHVEIKSNNGLFYSAYYSNNPGGSAKAPKLHNNFEKWKQATGFTGVFVPIAKTKEEARAMKDSITPKNNKQTKNAVETNEKPNFLSQQLQTLREKGLKKGDTAIIVSSKTQKTYVVKENGTILHTFKCSTAENGTGNTNGSLKTSTGTLQIRDKIGDGQPKLTRFINREPVGIVNMVKKDTRNDYMTTRILTLDGLDSDNKNAWDRKIYFHGTNEEFLLGKPASHGCIRLSNDDIITLHDAVKKGTMVQIV